MQEKEDFWRELDQNLERIERDEKVVIRGDFNGQVGAAKRGNEQRGVKNDLHEWRKGHQKRLILCSVAEATQKRQRIVR